MPRGTSGRDSDLDRLFSALADPTRRSLLARLALGPAKITDLARPYRMSLPAVSKHLRILEEAGLLGRRVDGRVHRISLKGRRLEQVEVWLDPFRSYWTEALRTLKDEVERTRPGRTTRRQRSVRAR
jgi:DNA-binding transcriptional ArsR family regulator